MTVHDLAKQREGALARVRTSIVEMSDIVQALEPGPSRLLAESLLNTLYKTEARLAGGLIHRSSRRG